MQPGDVFVLNAPYDGGTHLPDVTVVTPVFLRRRRAPSFFVASRGHHADIGGITPGSMPPDSTHDRRGRRADRQLAARRRTASSSKPSCARCLRGGRYPARNVEQNLADLRAQVAACEKGARSSQRWSRTSGSPVVQRLHAARAGQRRGIRAPRDRRAERRRVRVRDGQRRARSRSRSASIAAGASARIDFTGTSAQLPNNFNAPVAGARRRCCTCSARWSTTRSR